MDLIEVYDGYQTDETFNRTGLSRKKAPFIPGRGSETPKVLVVGPAPSAVDAAERRCFSGLVGASLRSLMELAGLTAKGKSPNAYVTHLVKYRRETGPTAGDLLTSRDFLRQEWVALGGPKAIIGIGDVVWKWLGPPGICENSSIHWSVGQQFILNGGNHFFPMYHPNYGIQHEEMRDKMEQQWEELGKTLRAEGFL